MRPYCCQRLYFDVSLSISLRKLIEIRTCVRALMSGNRLRQTMQQHWKEACVVRDEMDKRFREISSVAMLARRDIDRHIWLSECRPDLVPSAPAPPGVVASKPLRTKKTKKTKNADVAMASSKRTYYSYRGIDDMARSSGSELSDLLRFFSTLDMDLQKLLLEAITKRKSNKMTTKKDFSVQKDGCKFDMETTLPRQLRRSRSCTVARAGEEEESPCSFREWTHCSFKQQKCCRENAKFSTEEFLSPCAEQPFNSSCRLTNSSARPRGGCGQVDAEDEGVCRDVAIQTRRTLPKASKLNRKVRDQSWEVAKSLGTAARLLADHSAQTSSRGELIRENHSEEAIEKQREETTINVLERWAEPLEQYLSTLQKFEQQLREKWLDPEDIQTTSNSGPQTVDLESPYTHLTSDSLSETQLQRISTDEFKNLSDKPLLNRDVGTDGVASGPRDGVHPLLDNLKQENVANHESWFKIPKSLKLQDPDEKIHRAKAAANSMASGSLHGKPKSEYIAAGFRTRKLVECWPTEKQPRPHTIKSTSEPSIFSVYDPGALLVKQNPGEKPSVKSRRDKPEWWPALRRPYSAFEVEAMRQIEKATTKATAKATRRRSPSKIFGGYCARRPPSNKCQRRKTQEAETSGNQYTSQCVAQQDDDTNKRRSLADSPKRAAQIQISPLRLSPRKSHQKEKEHDLQMEGPQKVHKHCQYLSTVGELEHLNVKNSSQHKAGHGRLHALQEHSPFGIQRISNTVEDQVFGFTTQHQQIKTPRANIQAGVLSQANLRKKFRTPPAGAPLADVQNERQAFEKDRNKRNQSNSCVQQGIERLADKLIDQAVNEVASELAEFCENVADQMYSAEFVT